MSVCLALNRLSRVRLARRHLVGAFLVLLATAGTAIVAASAFTSQVVDLTARIEEVGSQRLEKNVVPNVELTPEEEALLPTGCERADDTIPIVVPAHTCVWWVVEIVVRNPAPSGSDMLDILVTDRFGPQLFVRRLTNDDVGDVGIHTISHSAGNGNVISREEVFWCVNGLLTGDQCTDSALHPGESSRLLLLVNTKISGKGKQFYTGTETKEMNSGANAKWTDGDTGEGESASTPPIVVHAIESDDDEDEDSPDATEAAAEPYADPSQAPASPGTAETTSWASPEPGVVPSATVVPSPESTPSPDIPPEPTPTPTPEPTPTASPEPTPTATPEPAPTAPPEPTPTATPEGGG